VAALDHVAWSCAEVARGGFDVVHVNQATALTLMRFVRVPFVYTLHHDRVEELSRFYSRLPDVHYVAISERQRQLEIPLPHVEVVHHGIDPAAFPFVAEPDDYVAFISRFAPTKAPHLAIDAAQRAGVPIRLAGCPHAGEGEAYHAREMVPRLRLPGVTWIGECGGGARLASFASVSSRLRRYARTWWESSARSATQDILGRGAEARVLRLHHARPPCRGWRSQRGTAGTRGRRVSRRGWGLVAFATGPVRAAAEPRVFVCRAGFASRGRAVGVIRTEHARVRFATQDVLGRAPSSPA